MQISTDPTPKSSWKNATSPSKNWKFNSGSFVLIQFIERVLNRIKLKTFLNFIYFIVFFLKSRKTIHIFEQVILCKVLNTLSRNIKGDSNNNYYYNLLKIWKTNEKIFEKMEIFSERLPYILIEKLVILRIFHRFERMFGKFFKKQVSRIFLLW